jgi:hypothetical protein
VRAQKVAVNFLRDLCGVGVNGWVGVVCLKPKYLTCKTNSQPNQTKLTVTTTNHNHDHQSPPITTTTINHHQSQPPPSISNHHHQSPPITATTIDHQPPPITNQSVTIATCGWSKSPSVTSEGRTQ